MEGNQPGQRLDRDLLRVLSGWILIRMWGRGPGLLEGFANLVSLVALPLLVHFRFWPCLEGSTFHLPPTLGNLMPWLRQNAAQQLGLQ